MKPTQLLFIFSLLISSFSMAQADTIDKNKFHFGKISDTSAGYTQVILTDNVLYLSGTVGRGATMAEQIKSAYTTIERTLKNYGAGFQNVVKENIYTTDIDAVKITMESVNLFIKGIFRLLPGFRSHVYSCPRRSWRWK